MDISEAMHRYRMALEAILAAGDNGATSIVICGIAEQALLDPGDQ